MMEVHCAGNYKRDYPDVDDGLEGKAFVDAVVRSAALNGAWTRLSV